MASLNYDAISNNFSQICKDVSEAVSAEEYFQILNDHSRPIRDSMIEAWCDLGDEGWVVE